MSLYLRGPVLDDLDRLVSDLFEKLLCQVPNNYLVWWYPDEFKHHIIDEILNGKYRSVR